MARRILCFQPHFNITPVLLLLESWHAVKNKKPHYTVHSGTGRVKERIQDCNSWAVATCTLRRY